MMTRNDVSMVLGLRRSGAGCGRACGRTTQNEKEVADILDLHAQSDGV